MTAKPARRHPLGSLVAVLAVVALVAGCGLAADDEPTPIAAEDIPEELLDPNPPTSGTTVPGATTPVTVYLLVVDDSEITRLVATQRDVADPDSAADRIEALLQPTSEEEQAKGYLSSIPPDTVLLDTDLIDARSELVIDLSGALFDVEGEELANAFAQIVWTVTDVPGVRQVRFRVDGEEYRAPNAEGIEQAGAVTTADYRSLAPEG